MIFRSENEIIQEYLAYAQNTGLLTLSEDIVAQVENMKYTENQYVLDISNHGYISSDMERKIEEIYNNVDINMATGEGLDILGRNRNVIRAPSQAATVNLTIIDDIGTDNDVHIPAGTIVEIDQTMIPSEDEYVTAEDCTLHANTLETQVQAINTRQCFTKPLPEGAVQGLLGFDTLRVTNPEKGTNGRNIEEDDEYRERIREWALVNQRGTKECLDDYLVKFDGLDGYRLIPRYDGPGTLKIICDCSESLLGNVAEGVQENCMLYTDDPVLCELPGEEHIEEIVLVVNLTNSALSMTLEELRQLIVQHLFTYVEGGTTRNGGMVPGMSIGDDFVPSQFLTSLVNTFPEILNVQCNLREIVLVDDSDKFVVDNVEVSFV